MIPIARCEFPEEAHVLKSRLEQEGIPVYIRNEFIAGNHWLLTNAVGGVVIEVPEEAEAEAREFLNENAGPDDTRYSDYTCPSCNSTKIQLEKFSLRAFFLTILFLGFPVPWYRPCLHCHECGHRWKRTQSE